MTVKQHIYHNVKRLIIFILLPAAIACSSPDVKSRDETGNTALHYAVFNRDTNLVKRLISKGADINAVNNYGITPLQCAAYVKSDEIMQLLISNGAVTNYTPPRLNDVPGVRLPANIRLFPEERLNFFLTFDTGSDNKNLDYILKTLKRYGIKATFFVTGQFIEKYPGDVRRIADEGHVVGNHTYSHCRFYRSEDHLLNELYETEYLYKKATGREITRIWRAPYLQHNGRPWIIRTAEKLGYRHIDVALYSRDWINPGYSGYVSNEKFLGIFRNRLGKKHTMYHGAMMLMHAGSFRDEGADFVFVLDNIICELLACGYLFDSCGRFESGN